MRFSAPCQVEHLLSRYIWSGKHVFHVVDPYLDLRNRFVDLNRLKSDIDARNLHVDVLSIAASYTAWWKRFYKNSKINCKDDNELRKKLRIKLLDLSDGLINAMKLPNIVDENTGLLSVLKNAHISFTGLVDEPGTADASVYASHNLRCWLDTMMYAHFEKPIQLAPHFLIRPALVEACCLDAYQFPTVQDHKNFFCLAGVSLPSMVACFVKKKMGLSNVWPINLFSFGEEYSYNPIANKFTQRSVFCVLSLHRDSPTEQSKSEMTAITFLASVHQMLSEKLLQQYGDNKLSKMCEEVKPINLHLYESAALAFANEHNSLGRYSRVGDYVSRRIHLTYDVENTEKKTKADYKYSPNFVKMNFLKIDVSAIAEHLFS